MFHPKTKILIVDDFPSMRQMIIRAFAQLGFSQFVEAGDGNIAWNALINIKPPIELVICDWNMPNCSGIEFLKKIKSNEQFRRLPFILTTTKKDKESVVEAIDLGVSNFVLKPFTVEIFRKKLEAVHQQLSK